MSVQVRVNPYYDSIRAVLHAVGKRECQARDFGFGPQGIGIHKWTFLAFTKIAELSCLGQWDGRVPNEPTIRRRANYLASKEWIDDGIPRPPDEPPLWEHLPSQIKDSNPWKSREVVEFQSGYTLTKDAAKKRAAPTRAIPAQATLFLAPTPKAEVE